jgi:hypothetical protein
MIYYGSNKIGDVYIGNQKICKVYQGSNLVFSGGESIVTTNLAKFLDVGEHTFGGITFTISADGNITLNGTSEYLANYVRLNGTFKGTNVSNTDIWDEESLVLPANTLGNLQVDVLGGSAVNGSGQTTNWLNFLLRRKDTNGAALNNMVGDWYPGLTTNTVSTIISADCSTISLYIRGIGTSFDNFVIRPDLI